MKKLILPIALLIWASCTKTEIVTKTVNDTITKTKTDTITKIIHKVVDMDGNYYDTVAIGTQVWLVQNLRVTKLCDGTAIPLVTNENSWIDTSPTTTPGYTWFNDSVKYKTIYGALYNWYAVNTGKLCPCSYRVAADSDYNKLLTYVGTSIGSLKSVGTVYWINPNVGATNTTGFTALPGGAIGDNGFVERGSYAWFWTSTPVNTTSSNYFLLDNANSNYGLRSDGSLPNGMSVRCIRN